MPRSISTDFRNSLEASSSEELILCFATISHAVLSSPVRIVSDVVDYLLGGERFFGVPFDIQLLSDDEKPPQASMTIQNVDRVLGEIVRTMTISPRLKLEVYAGSDWGDPSLVDDRKTRSPTGTPTVEYSADFLRLSSVTCDAMTVSAQIESFDLTTEPWPSIRATHERCPALYR